MKINKLLLTAAMFAAVSCSTQGGEQDYGNLTKVDFLPTEKSFINPERGFYSGRDFRGANISPMTVANVQSYRLQGRSLIYLGFYLDAYMDGDIADSYLQAIQKTFDALRQGGCKAILRFAYKWDYNESDHPWDATVEQTMRHIEQLSPLLRENADVIYTMQAGFIGAWGEWYYTDHFNYQASTAAQFAPRKALVDALLAALPESRQVCVRTPEYKMKMYGLSVADTLTAATAHNGSAKARVAGHNDCFVASSSDYGTFNSPNDRIFWAGDTRYTIMGGETCNPCSYSKCDNTLKDLAEQHWSYLNIGYHSSVISGWRSEGCFNEIERRLGYRLTITEGYVKTSLNAGGNMRVVLKVANEGFAAPMNPRDVELVLVAADGSEEHFAVDANPRTWYAGTTSTVDTTVALPAGMKAGTYKLYLNLPDPCERLRSDARYSIRLANRDVWDEEKGYNYITDVNIK